MQYIFHEVLNRESLPMIAEKYGVTPEMIRKLNYLQYPDLLKYPYMVFEGWVLRVPFVSNGGSTQYDFV